MADPGSVAQEGERAADPNPQVMESANSLQQVSARKAKIVITNTKKVNAVEETPPKEVILREEEADPSRQQRCHVNR